MRSSPVPERSRTRGQRTATGPTPVTISRSGRWPWRTSLWRPSSVSLSAWQLSRAATSASTACASNARAPLRKTSVSGSAKGPGWESWKTLVSVTAYHSLYGAFVVKEFGQGHAPSCLGFFVRSDRPFLRPDPRYAHVGARRSCQGWPFAPALQQATCLPGHTLTAPSTTARSVRSGLRSEGSPLSGADHRATTLYPVGP